MALYKLPVQTEAYTTRNDVSLALLDLFKSAYDALEEGVCIVDEHRSIQYANRAYCEFFNLPKQDIRHPASGTVVIDGVLNKVLVTKKNYSGQLKRTGYPHHLYVEGVYFSDSQGGAYAMGRYTEKAQDVLTLPATVAATLENPYSDIYCTLSPRLIKELQKSKKAAATTATILIRGESGTGKELVAKAIHQNSPRASMPFMAVNCGAIPQGLIESVLFGHEEGSFTGANKSKIGLVEAAHGGTLFLDEVGDLPLEAQVKLLRLLQERCFMRVGSHKVQSADVRVIAATHRPLEQMLSEGSFREDLYYRLNVVGLELTPLRERLEDLKVLSERIIENIAKKHACEAVRFDDRAYSAMCAYAWPGNVRELENVIEQMCVLYAGECVGLDALPTVISHVYLEEQRSAAENPTGFTLGLGGQTGDLSQMASFETYESQIIARALETYGSFNAAGKALGLTHKTVAAKARKYNLVT
jgi:transcriptional regulator with PAS, ATPase and Fis domain